MPVDPNLDTNDLKTESNHIKAAEFPDNWKAPLVVSDVNVEVFKREGERERKKFILSFAGKTKTYVVNAKNQAFIEAALGTKPAKWIGATVTLARSKTLFNGAMVPCFVIIGATPAPQHTPTQDERQPGEDAAF